MNAELESLIQKWVATKAIQIKIDSGKHHQRNSSFNREDYVADIKNSEKAIYKFFQTKKIPYDSEAVRKSILEYIKLQEEISRGFNDSFTELRRRIERGEYDFDFAKKQTSA